MGVGYNRIGTPATNIQLPLATTPSTQFGDEESWVRWRTIRTAVLDCTCLGVAGNGFWESYGRLIDWFIIKAVVPPGGGGGKAEVYAEYLGASQTGFSAQNVVKGVRLIE